MPEETRKKEKWIARLKTKYRLVIMNESTYEEKLSFKLSRLNVFVTMASTAIILIIMTIFIIAFTPLREYIPGYMDPEIPAKVYFLEQKADSLENDLRMKNLYLTNIRNIIEGKDVVSEIPQENDSDVVYEINTLERSKEDSILRAEYERHSRYNLYENMEPDLLPSMVSASGISFFSPISGIITNHFNLEEGHYGVDIVAESNETIKAVLEGTVIFADWTLETGYVIGIQHQGNFISVYKHNATLLKKQGTYVQAGEPIAIIGDSGEMTTGPHLHFELWHNGTPLNPEEYVSF
jgi:murein DD-endopeptidase MepM/ murein hydrolase activator NlpD